MCVNQRVRSKQYVKYFYCTVQKREVILEECKKCCNKEYKKAKPIRKKKKAVGAFKEFSIMPESSLYSIKREIGLDRHEVFYGNGKREISIREGMVIFLTPKKHNMSDNGIHFNREFDLEVKRIAQRKYEETHTREEFIRTFGKSYLL